MHECFLHPRTETYAIDLILTIQKQKSIKNLVFIYLKSISYK